MPEQIGISPPRSSDNGKIEKIYTSSDTVDLLKQIAFNTGIEYIVANDIFDSWSYVHINDITEFAATQTVNNSKTLRLARWLDRKLVRILKISMYFDSSNAKNISVEIIKNFQGLDGYERVFSATANTSQSIVLEFTDSYTYPSSTLGGLKITTSNGTSTDHIGISISLAGIDSVPQG